MQTRKLVSLFWIFPVLWACHTSPPTAEVPPEPTLGEEIALLEDLRPTESPDLVALLTHEEAFIRARAALAMGRIQSLNYVPHLQSRLAEETSNDALENDLFALGQMGLAVGNEPPEGLSEALEGLIDHPADGVGAAAVEALGKVGSLDNEERLAEVLQGGSSVRLREEAAMALFRLRFAPVWRRQTEEPPPLGALGVGALIHALDDEAARVRIAAAHYFSRFPQSEGLEALAQRLGDAEYLVRLFAARGLKRIADPASLPALQAAADDPSASVRTEVVAALAACGDADNLPAALLSDPSFHVRTAVVQAFAQGQDEASIERLRTFLEDASPTVRAATVGALGQRLGDDAPAFLKNHLSPKTPWTDQVAAISAIGSLAPEHQEEALDLARKTEDSRIISPALFAASPEVLEASLPHFLASPDLAIRGSAVERIKDLEQGQRETLARTAYEGSTGVDWVEVREALVDQAAALEAEDLLREMLHDEATSVQAKAVRALTQLGLTVNEIPPANPQASRFLGQAFPSAPIVGLETNKGRLRVQTLPESAPIHVANFLELVNQGFYDGLPWHRVVPNFVIQGGDPLGNGWGGPGYALRDEISRVRFKVGTLGMPKAGKDTGGCQLFFTHIPTPHLDGNYTIYGQVIEGLEVIDLMEVGDVIEKARVENSEPLAE